MALGREVRDRIGAERRHGARASPSASQMSACRKAKPGLPSQAARFRRSPA